jgi:hypothetical protein
MRFILLVVLLQIPLPFAGAAVHQARLTGKIPWTYGAQSIDMSNVLAADNRLWIGADFNFLCFDPASKEWSLVLDEAGAPMRCASLTASRDRIYVGQYGNASGQFGNLTRLDPASLRYETLPPLPIPPECRAVKFYASGDCLWVATDCGEGGGKPGLTQLSPDGKLIRHWKLPPAVKIRAKYVDEDGKGVTEYTDHRWCDLVVQNGFLWAAFTDQVLRFDLKRLAIASWSWKDLVGQAPDTVYGGYHGYFRSQWVKGSSRPDLVLEIRNGASGHSLRTYFLRYDARSNQWNSESSYVSVPAARQDGLLWVGASYDTHAGSRFVLRYIEDAGKKWRGYYSPALGGYSGFAFLGTDLWALSRTGLFRFKRGASTATRYFLRPDPEPYRAGRPTAAKGGKEDVPLESFEGTDFPYPPTPTPVPTATPPPSFDPSQPAPKYPIQPRKKRMPMKRFMNPNPD